MESAVRVLLKCIGEDIEREGLKDTPKRVAKSLLFLTKGYRQEIGSIINNSTFKENYHEIVIVKDIDICSLCEHHMLPFIGKVHIGYIPKSKIIGLSETARIVDMYTRRLQVQERLTKNIAEELSNIINAKGVAVYIEAIHTCMTMRGVEKLNSSTITTFMTGEFKNNQNKRLEFMKMIK